MNSYQAKQIPLTGLLTQLGYQPEKESRGELWYLSPFRQETDASFTVNPKDNVWYDFGMGKGGNILDFAMQYYRVDFTEALKILSEQTSHRQISAVRPALIQETAQPSHLDVINVQPLVNRALIAYLNQRKIPVDVAKHYVQEIYYTRNEKTYFSLAFPNDSNGYELRNPYFKGVHGQKDITLLHGENRAAGTVAIFEGFINFLSALVYYGKEQADSPVLVLNTTAMKDKAMAVIKQMGIKTAYLYLDHDNGGRALARHFQAQLPEVDVQDRADLYAGYNDFNDWLIADRIQTSQRAR